MMSDLGTNRPQTIEEREAFLHRLLQERFGVTHPKPHLEVEIEE